MSADVLGWAWRTPLGDSVDTAVSRLLAGERAATDTLRFETRTYACRLGAPILSVPQRSKHARFLRRMGLFGLEAAHAALQQARAHGCEVSGERLGVFCGYGGLRAHWDDMMEGLSAQQPEQGGTWERGLKRIHPYWMLKHLSNNAHALLAADLSARGDGATYGGATAGAQALSAAIRSLEAGSIDVALVFAYDSLLEPETLVDLAARGAATTGDLANLAAPYDVHARGFVPGEAAAALVLQRPGAAGALASIAAADGADGQASDPSSETLAAVASRLTQGDTVVDGSARALPAVDAAERSILAPLLGGGARLTAVQSAFGQLGAATALVQAIALASCLRRGVLPPIAGLREPAEGPLVPVREPTPTEAQSVLALSTGAPGLAGAVRVHDLGRTRRSSVTG
ncbi:beta-ketoacyl synthase N-terminal-like domain-containing protein [Hyalangium sp.]|uniref:beta-ketoacyl synthase N-terminal-like domain-containing protein n=1 Tax=Hyalangium sp. TaxID=2028555 RepID=UPI002D51CB8E|nr:beta-ketoacyl synthase N-terminal-like domain-containing protein [Hyalangium sp.]HYI01134.1 beta-ketoacyl synthase N-terminal-like domain-containing protein [Hyalangium sp.]